MNWSTPVMLPCGQTILAMSELLDELGQLVRRKTGVTEAATYMAVSKGSTEAEALAKLEQAKVKAA